MSKKRKIGLIVGGIIVLILAIMFIIPVLFKGKIKNAVVEMANKNLNAKVEIGDFGLSLFKNFPNATLSLYNTSIVGIDSFASDTLLFAEDLSITMNIKSLFGDTYEVNNISLTNGLIETLFDKSGKFNWDITKKSDEVQANSTSKDSTNFSLLLQNIDIQNTTFKHIDQESNMATYLYGINGKISGDFSAKETTLKIKANSEELKFYLGKMPYLSKVKVKAEADIHADFDQMKFEFKDSKLFLNNLLTTIEGSFAFIGDDGYNFDLRLKAPNANFNQILSLIPSMYNDELKTLKTSGSVSLDAYLVGDMTEDNFPNLNLRLIVNNAMFQYPQLPKPVQDINLYLNVNGKMGDIENLSIKVDKFGFRIDENKLEGSFSISPIPNDQIIEGQIEGQMNLATIKDVYPLPTDINLSGHLSANLSLNTTKSAIKQENYKNISTSGSLILSDMNYSTNDFPNINLRVLDVKFNPSTVDLNKLDLNIGDSDLQAEGKLQNVIGYLFNDQTIKGNLDINSKKLDLDNIMSHFSTSDTTKDPENEKIEKTIIPTNIDFTASCNMALVIFDNMNITNVSGKAFVKDGILTFDKISAGILGGLTTISGSYTSTDENPKLNMNLNLTRASFAETFKNIESVKQFAPIFSDILGTYSMNLNLSTSIYDNLPEILSQLTANGALLSNDFKLEGNKTLKTLGSLLKTDKLDKISANNLNLPFDIKDGILTTKPFDITFGNGLNMALQGSTKLDQSIDYQGTITLPSSMTNNLISKVPISIKGSFSDPKIEVDTKTVATDAITNVVGDLLGVQKNEDGSSSLNLNEEKEKKIEELRQKANDTADKLVNIAKEQSEELVKKAGENPLAQIAAKKAAAEVVKKAEKEAQKLKDEAEEQIKKLENKEQVSEEE